MQVLAFPNAIAAGVASSTLVFWLGTTLFPVLMGLPEKRPFLVTFFAIPIAFFIAIVLGAIAAWMTFNFLSRLELNFFSLLFNLSTIAILFSVMRTKEAAEVLQFIAMLADLFFSIWLFFV
ncbi:MAG: hypothetical protein Q4G39_06785 [Brachymonas sp.]|nr:hypothetical protein [Brachymonas sp.]